MSRFSSLLALALCCFVGPSPLASPTSLPSAASLSPWPRLSLHKTYHLTARHFYKVQQTAFGSNTKVLQHLRYTYAVKVVSRSASRLVLELRYKRIASRLRLGRYQASYDSARPPKKLPPRMQAYATLVGHRFRVHLDATAKVTQITHTQKMLKALTRDIPKQYPYVSPSMHKAMRAKLKHQFGPKQLRRQMSELWMFLPPRRLAPGSQWKRTTTHPIYSLKQEAQWKLLPTKSKAWKLSLSARLHTPQSGITPFGVGFTQNLRYTLSGRRSGTLYLSKRHQLPLKGKLQTSISGTIRYIPPKAKSPKPKPAPKNTLPQPAKGKKRKGQIKKRAWTVYFQTRLEFGPKPASSAQHPPKKRKRK